MVELNSFHAVVVNIKYSLVYIEALYVELFDAIKYASYKIMHITWAKAARINTS